MGATDDGDNDDVEIALSKTVGLEVAINSSNVVGAAVGLAVGVSVQLLPSAPEKRKRQRIMRRTSSGEDHQKLGRTEF